MLYSRGLRFLAKSLLSCLVLVSSVAMAAEPKVVVSIKPLELIASAITDGVTTPELLLQPGTSPHNYSLKPSDIQKLASANVVFWIGEDLEGFLEAPLQHYASDAKSIELMHAPDMKIQRFSSAKADDHEDHDHASHAAHIESDHGGHHHHGIYDPHVWLSPDNAIAMAAAMTQTLSEIDKDNADVYKANYSHFAEIVKKADATNKNLLSDLHDKGFFVFHDGWGYFTHHYDLKVLDVFTLSPEQQPGARHMLQLRNKLKDAGQTCVFREPQFHPAYLATMVDKLPVKVDVIDPLASEVLVQPRSYPEYLTQLSTTIQGCLTLSHS
ncbi:zinc ABC transporter substrate-binding protein ZnuA [Sansalvadorimonas verongulae]|uniref:zinc ABC transporter substrate-binding protein ZnuA n=1 Tax=Sansalvadorimonas verongulae TaxID=2172824 RepID=UPI0012BBE57B|nr:zinc ABC transporter substrate-binding protein ZnuA [Sansalvadorimonas verongulae]MTI12074.1 zinc ABC transporter substrate-binding protein ZnuA [Sansalvadorimonas verongulae]